ncbi:hypothetical protein KAZ57_01395 [Patescibacteria group bacterium]|nr:hypothetical protein [Patescibacteria group bacterium]
MPNRKIIIDWAGARLTFNVPFYVHDIKLIEEDSDSVAVYAMRRSERFCLGLLYISRHPNNKEIRLLMFSAEGALPLVRFVLDEVDIVRQVPVVLSNEPLFLIDWKDNKITRVVIAC